MRNLKRILSVSLILAMVLSTLTACSFVSQMQIKGSWRDSTGTTGYEFKSDNICVITYADVTIPIINIQYDGSIDGAYSIEKKDDGKNYVKITYTILSKSVTEEYAFDVNGGTLTLTDPEDGTSKVLMEYNKDDASTTATTAAE